MHTWTDRLILTSLSSDYFTRFRTTAQSDNRFRRFFAFHAFRCLASRFFSFASVFKGQKERAGTWELRVELYPFILGSQVEVAKLKVRKCSPTAITFGSAACLITPSGHVSRAPLTFARRIWTSALSALIALSCYPRDISPLETTIIAFKGNIRLFSFLLKLEFKFPNKRLF